MDYRKKPQYHYRPEKGWINDPNGLVYFKGYYHVFYQHCPHHEYPWREPVHWGHARTRDFLLWEELPVALTPDMPYDIDGCWSGTALVKDDTLYLFYASIRALEEYNSTDHTISKARKAETISVARSTDGIHFEKYENNPVLDHFPSDGGPVFRDPAVAFLDGIYYCAVASGNPESRTARLLLYQSEDLLNWRYAGIAGQWENCIKAECPSLLPAGEQTLLASSVCWDGGHRFSISFGSFVGSTFVPAVSGVMDRGPDQYAGQIFRDHKGRNILISWIPGWKYRGFIEKDIGCLSVPREIFLRDGKICGWPVQEVAHLLTDSDPAVIRTDTGFTISRTGREPVIHNGPVYDLKMIRDEYLLEVFVNGGEDIYSVLL